MAISRVVPNIPTLRIAESRQFYEGLFGFRVGMDLGWIVTLVAPDTPTAQIGLVRAGAETPLVGDVTLTIQVSNVYRVHEEALSGGFPIVYPLTDETWGVRRFHVKDPNGVLINVMEHIG